uniref:Exonuclease n=1 Tax=Desulfobacca acetoxidans TaxID=60893 RepID=A0A7C3V672_9BACT
MVKRTFIHLPGIGLRTEAQFWRRGLNTWEDFLQVSRVGGLGAERLTWLKGLLQESLNHLDHPEYFASRLPSQELWRLFRHFRSRTAYLDIETTGAGWPELAVTVVGIYDGRTMQQFVLGHNLMDFPSALADVEVLVTFNGSQFDLPVLRACFPGVRLPAVHLDLRFILARLGYRGGLKRIEPMFGIFRAPEVAGLNGFDAVLLWERFQRGDLTAGERLLQYNREDVLNLENLMEQAFELGESLLLKGGGAKLRGRRRYTTA